MTQYSDQIVEVLLSVLQRPDVDSQIKQVHDYIKPGIFSCLGDVAMAIGAGMDKYLQHWFMALQVGCQMCMQMLAELSAEDGYDEDKRYYLSALMDGVLDGYVGIVQGLKEASQSHPDAHKAFLQPVALAEGSLMLLKTVAQDGDKTPMVLQHAVGAAGRSGGNVPGAAGIAQSRVVGASFSKRKVMRNKKPGPTRNGPRRSLMERNEVSTGRKFGKELPAGGLLGSRREGEGGGLVGK